MIETLLFVSRLVRLAPLDPARDAETISRWSHDPQYVWQLDDAPAYPLSADTVRKQIADGHTAEDKPLGGYSFAIRYREGDELAGIIRVGDIQWSHGAARLSLGIGAPAAFDDGVAADALKLILRYAFAELNLHRLETVTAETNEQVLRILRQAGFTVEVRRRQAIARDGRRWDLLHLGLLREEWARQSEAQP